VCGMHAGDRLGVAIDCAFLVTWVELGAVAGGPRVPGVLCTWRQWCRAQRRISKETLWRMPPPEQRTLVAVDLRGRCKTRVSVTEL
jgi:hypothetical protein